MAKKAIKVQEQDEIEKIVDELEFVEQPKKAKKTSKKAEKVEQEQVVEDLNDDKVSYREIIEILCELPKDDFRNVIKVAKQVRRTNDMIATYFGEEEDE
ncbi:MAG: hypothetical protein ACI4TD_04180 [Phocaeicola sp.]